MFKNYIKIAFRNILKHKGYAAINVLGLAGSTAIAILILFYVYQVFTFDMFNKDADRIYFMYRDRATEDGRLNVWDTWYPMLDVAKQEFPGIETGTRMMIGSITNKVTYGEQSFDQEIHMADSNFFDVFSYELVQGDRETALDDMFNVVISQEMAKKFFGDENPMGKILDLEGDQHTVTGVLGKMPPNSSFDIECIAPLSGNYDWVKRAGWRGSFLYTFVKLDKNSDPDNLRPQLHQLLDKYASPAEKGNVLIEPLAGFNDLFTEKTTYATILLIVAIGIILIAAINFTNLSTAQSMLRAKEVGVRKVMGAGKLKLIIQFLSESMLMAFIALIIGGLIAELLLPVFSELVDMKLSIDYLSHPEYMLATLILGLIIGLLSGFYPAIYLSRHEPSYILKGGKDKGGSLFFRNGLVVIQFALAIILMSGVGIIISQVEFMKNYDTNFDKENVMVIPISSGDFETREQGISRILAFKEEIKQIAGVESVSASSVVPGGYRSSFGLFLASDRPNSQALDWRYCVVDDQYFQTYGIDLVEGNYFERTPISLDNGTDRIILNKAAIDYLGWKTAADKMLLYPSSDNKAEIVGVVENFNVEALRNEVQPIVHYVSGDSSRSFRYLSIKISPKSRTSVMDQVSKTWDKMEFAMAYDYYFPNDHFKELYAEEENMAKILTYASGLSIIIACLGLFALASFTIMLRSKEVAIRKVLGASVSIIVGKFTRHFTVPVFIAIITAIPITYYAMGQWLQTFAFRSSIDPTVFIITGFIALFIAVASVGYHAIKIGYKNPVDSLRDQ